MPSLDVLEMTKNKQLTIAEIVKDWLVAHGYDGLCNSEQECGCRLDNLMPCEYPQEKECAAGYAFKNEVHTEKTESRFVGNGDGTISDTKTGLIWQAEHTKPVPWDEAMEYAKNLKFAGQEDWRLPTIEELLTLVDSTHRNPATEFPGAIPYGFWSSSSYAADTSYAAYVSFYSGSVLHVSKTNNCHFRCVRGEQGASKGE